MNLPLWVTLGLMVAVVVMGLVIWSIRRHHNPRLEVECGDGIADLLPSLAGLSLGSPVGGNRVEVCENGAFFDRLIDEIRRAEKSVHFETFLWKKGALGQRLADALCERGNAGISVRVLLDANGSKDMGDEAQNCLKSAGCRLVQFHRHKLRHIGVLNDRDHRKLCIVDGRVAFLGGHCIVDTWLGDARGEGEVADVSVRLEGPIVGHVQAAFSENWVGHTGELFAGAGVFPPLEAQPGGVPAHLAYSKPEGSAPAVKILHHAVICFARRRLWIMNPYFIPEPDAIEAFGQAVARGVDVQVMMPSTGGSDNPLVQHAGHRNFEALLLAGVRLFEYPHTLLHQKVLVIDSLWSSVGSCNFDDRSFEINDEITLGILDAATAQRLEAVFERYLPDCKEIRLDAWRARGWRHKLVDKLAYSINEIL